MRVRPAIGLQGREQVGGCTIMFVLTVQLDAGHRVRFKVSVQRPKGEVKVL